MSDEITHLEFNQENNCLAMGTKTGFKIFNCDPFGKCYEREEGGQSVVSMLFCTSLVALVGGGEAPTLASPRTLRIENTKRETTISQLSFLSRILAVRLNRKRLMVVLEEKVHIYDLTTMKELHSIDTPPNVKGVGALSPSSDNCYLACLSQDTTGDLLLFDALNLQPITILQAHKSPIAQASFNGTGTLLATASEKGTVIRVFSVPDGVCRHQFRRGSFTAEISALSFNAASSFLTVSSDSETVHIFKLPGDRPSLSPADRELEETATGRAAGGPGGVAQYMPAAITEILEPARHFAHLKLPEGKVHHISALNNTIPQVMVATKSGYFYIFAIDLERGGECTLVKQFNMLSLTE